jgi:hypothetical protein
VPGSVSAQPSNSHKDEIYDFFSGPLPCGRADRFGLSCAFAVSATASMLLCRPTRNFACAEAHFDKRIDLADDVTREASNDVALVFALGCLAGSVSLRGLVVLCAHDHRVKGRGVDLSVPALLDAMLAAGHP